MAREMSERDPWALVAILFLVIAGLVTLHQFVCWGTPFEVEDVHHETFVVAFSLAGIVLLLSRKLSKP